MRPNNRELGNLLSASGPVLVEVGDITRFRDRGHFASWAGPHRSMLTPDGGDAMGLVT
jgi:hypothetical protein